jgi:hypothetical protein
VVVAAVMDTDHGRYLMLATIAWTLRNDVQRSMHGQVVVAAGIAAYYVVFVVFVMFVVYVCVAIVMLISRNGYLLQHYQILRWFVDAPGSRHPYSIHNIIRIARKFNKKPGEWFEPSTISLVLKYVKHGVEQHDGVVDTNMLWLFSISDI